MHGSPNILCSGADFCQELSGASDTEFLRTYHGNPANRIIARSSNFSLMVDLSPLTVGHLLLVSNEHYLSFGEAMAAHGSEVVSVLRRIFTYYAETFGDPVVFEHGSSYSSDGFSCITHAHLHLLPLSFNDVHDTILSDGLSSSELTCIEELGMLADRGLPYFYCGDAHSHRVYGVAQKVRRQYLRSVAGRLLGIADPEWDYALVVRKDLFRSTMAKAVGWVIDPA